MKIVTSTRFKVVCTLFLTLAVTGVQNTNAQFWKKKKKETPTQKVVPKKKDKTLLI